ncbi:TPA: helix-turn-helix domain-containing protein [Vibrio parahaemolyticus]|nr:helix-turn-helix domain-containing protein [Vibrio parahaemolyticus]
MTLAERLTELRVDKRASLQVVADSVGVSKPHIWELEKGKTKNPSLELLKKLAVYYGVTLDSLVGLDQGDNSGVHVLFRNFDMVYSDLSEEDRQTIKQALEMAQALIKQRKDINVR